MSTFPAWATRFGSRRLATLAATGVLLSGCGNMQEHLRPAAPPRAVQPAKEVAVGLRPGGQAPGAGGAAAPVTLDELKEVVRALRSDIIGAAEQKNNQSWNANLTTLIGGTMATVGAVASRTGLTNTGVALALLGLTSEQFYKPVSAIDVHLDADSKLLCVEDATFGLTEAERTLALKGDYPGSAEALGAVDLLNHSLNGMMLAYRRSLLGIRPGTPTRADLLGFMKRFQADAAAADAGSKYVPPSGEEAQAAAAQKFIGLSTSLEACTKLGVSAPK